MNQLKDFVKLGTTEEVQLAIANLIAVANRCVKWVEQNHSRDDKRVVAVNFVQAASRYLGYLNEAQGAGTPLPIVALSARCIFEMDLRFRKVLESSDELKKWLAETATDRVDFYDAVIQLSPDVSMPDPTVLRKEAERIRGLLAKYALPTKAKPPATKGLADDAGLIHDYPVFYRLSSKFVHPSAWVVNDQTALTSAEFRLILIALLQLYTWQMLHRFRDAFSMPDDVLFPKP